jgi:hypothetical protein
VLEKARFVVGDQIVLLESGLPAGTPWSVTVRGFTTNSSFNNMSIWETPGKYGFTVSPYPGYRVIPHNGVFTVNSGWSLVRVRYVLITPPQPAFPVMFHLSGLPSTSGVSITVRNATQTTGAFFPRFQLTNGSYSYDVGYVAGYHPGVRLKTFVVRGGPLTVEVPFVPTVYAVSWLANGSRDGMNWSVTLNGQVLAAKSAYVSASLPNGSYSYAIQLPVNYSTTPRTGDFVVGGSAMRLNLTFSLLQFATWFEATGPGAFSAWSVRLGSLTHGASASRSSFLAPNGTYTFDVHPPQGYFAVPSHGNVTVAGAGPPTAIQFVLVSDRPSAALSAALSSGAMTVSIWIGVSIFVGFAAVRWLRRPGG